MWSRTRPDDRGPGNWPAKPPPTPPAVQSAKRLMRMGLNETFNDHVHHVYLQFLQLIRTGDFREGMTSFLEKRPADFHGR